jgi:hypothetical protein
MRDIPRTREKRRVDAAKDRAIKKEIRQIERELIAIKKSATAQCMVTLLSLILMKGKSLSYCFFTVSI